MDETPESTVFILTVLTEPFHWGSAVKEPFAGSEPFTVSDKEAILCAFYDNAPLLMGVVELCDNNTDVRFLLVNRALSRLFNCEPHVLQNKKASEVNAAPEVLAHYINAFSQAKRTKRSVRFEDARSRAGGGMARFFEVTVSAIAGEPNANHFLVIGEDITVRHEAQQKMRLMQSIVENAHDAILITGAPLLGGDLSDGGVGSEGTSPRIIYVNAAFERLMGYTLEEAIGQTPQCLLLPEKHDEQNAAGFRDALLHGQAVQQETLLQHKNGTTVWVEMSFCPAPANHDTRSEPHCIGILRDISARKQTESQMRLRDRAMEASNCGIDIVEAKQNDLSVVYVNPAYEKITGFTSSEVLGKNPRDIFAAGVQDPAAGRAIGEALENEREVRITLENTRKDGSRMWRDLHISPVRDEETGRVTHFIGIHNDVTQQKEAEEELLLRERAFVAASNGIVICDARRPDMPIVYSNPAFTKMTGYEEAEVIGRNCPFLQGADMDATVREEIRYALQNSRDCIVVLKNYRKNGEPFWNELYISPVRDTQGVLTHFVGVQNDITERQTAQTALLEAEARLRYVIRNLPLVVFAINNEGVFTFSDGKGLETLGLKPGEVVGRSVWATYPDEPILHERITRALNGEYVIFTADVAGTVWETIYNPLQAANGDKNGLIGFALDVTERTKLEAQVLQSDKLAAMGQLVAGVAHEINNPLAAISGSAQLLALHPDPEVQDDARAIKTMTDRASAVVRSLLTFAHPSKGARTEERALHTLRQLALDTLHLSQYSLRQSNIDVHLDFVPDEPPVFVNGNQIQQIILNLLTNAEYALRCAPEGSDRHLIITTAWEKEADYVSVTIADNGCGISPALVKRIFEPFFTTKDVGEGTGLGLSICHSIAVAHEGTLYVENLEGVGAAFTLRLPTAKMDYSRENT